jgi:hypothetical protein
MVYGTIANDALTVMSAHIFFKLPNIEYFQPPIFITARMTRMAGV